MNEILASLRIVVASAAEHKANYYVANLILGPACGTGAAYEIAVTHKPQKVANGQKEPDTKLLALVSDFAAHHDQLPSLVLICEVFDAPPIAVVVQRFADELKTLNPDDLPAWQSIGDIEVRTMFIRKEK